MSTLGADLPGFPRMEPGTILARVRILIYKVGVGCMLCEYGFDHIALALN
jgi:hypothetical protein